MTRTFVDLDRWGVPAAPELAAAISISGRAVAQFAPMPERCVRYAFSDASVGRDMHTIAPDAWVTQNFEANPVFLWAHDGDEPPIGRVEDLGVEGGRLVGTVRYIDADLSPFADTIYRMVQGRFLNATSTGWMPLQWRAANDRNRPGGLDFTKVELLEISQVPVPALPTALAIARAAGIDTRPLFDWAGRVLDLGGYAAARDELEQIRKAAKMPKPSRAAPTEPPAAERANPRLIFKRGLWTVSWLACLLEDLSIVQESTEWEAAAEGDESPIPGRLLDAVKALGAILVDMTAEEVAELLGGDEADAPAEVADAAERARLLRSLVKVDAHVLRGLSRAAVEVASGYHVTISTRAAEIALHRIGKTLSAENERCLREALTHHEEVARCIKRVLPPDEEAGETDPDDETAERAARELRERKARAARAKLASV